MMVQICVTGATQMHHMFSSEKTGFCLFSWTLPLMRAGELISQNVLISSMQRIGTIIQAKFGILDLLSIIL